MGKYKVSTTLRKICGMKKRIRVVSGGQGASKSISILMILINHASSKPNRRILVVSQELAKMRNNIIPDFIDIMKDFGLFDDRKWNIQDAKYSFPNGSVIKFVGSDKIDAGKGTRTSACFFNEANKIQFEAYRELSTRSDNIFIDYNPNYRCWIDENVIPREDCDFLRVTYLDNEYLGEAEREEILHYKELAYNPDGSVKSEYWENVWRVYGCGEVGHFVGTILTNITTGEFDDSLPSVYGYDCGYNDQDALVKVAVDHKKMKVYIDEQIYQNNLSNADITKLVKQKTGNSIVVCDNAAAKTIADFKQAHINAVPCRKNKIVDNIKDIQGYTIVLTPRSTNAHQEFNNWRWKDVQGKSIPSDGNNHTIDASFYAFVYLTTPAPRKSSVIITQ